MADASIKHQISGQFTAVVKGYMYMFYMVDTTFSSGRPLVVCYFRQKSFEVVCMKSEMQILCFYLVEQRCGMNIHKFTNWIIATTSKNIQ